MEQRHAKLRWLLLIVLATVGAVSIPAVRPEPPRSSYEAGQTGAWKTTTTSTDFAWIAFAGSAHVSAAIAEAAVSPQPETAAPQADPEGPAQFVSAILAFPLYQRPPPNSLLR